MSSKKLKAQMRIFSELETQLLTQAERLGIRDQFTPLYQKEIEYDALKKHILSFYAERANLEYEMQMQGTDKKVTLIKLERLQVYIKRAERMQKQYEEKIRKIVEQFSPDKEKVEKALGRGKISVSVGGN